MPEILFLRLRVSLRSQKGEGSKTNCYFSFFNDNFNVFWRLIWSFDEQVFIRTLPNMVQSRILSFLDFERQGFCGRDLARLARTVLSGSQELDLWVQRSARNLLDGMSESSYDWIKCLSLESVEDAFESLPSWLKDSVASSDLVLPWLPISPEELNSRTMSGNCENYDGSSSQVGEDEDVFMNDVLEEMNIDDPVRVHLEP